MKMILNLVPPLYARLLFILLIRVGISDNAFAQAGSLDITFGTNGKVITSLGSFGDRANSVAIRNNDKILLGGFTQNSFTSSDFALVQYNKDGSLDSTFGIGGNVITPIENRSEANALAIQSDGKILLGGTSKWYLNIVRYNSKGIIDSTFGANGKVITDVEGYYSEQCKSLLIQSDGKILVGGYGQHNNSDISYFVLLRYNNNGTLDSAFGMNGTVIGMAGKGNSMAIQSDGKILIGGSSNSAFAIERYNANGIVDSTFGIKGKVITDIGDYSSEGNSITIQSDGKILLTGYAHNNIDIDFALVRYEGDADLGIVNNCCKQWHSKIYPNPFNSSTTLQFNRPLYKAELNIYNGYGQLVKQVINISGQKIQLSRNNLPCGIYSLRVIEENKTITVNKLVIDDK